MRSCLALISGAGGQPRPTMWSDSRDRHARTNAGPRSAARSRLAASTQCLTMTLPVPSLSHLDRLEAESIHILREVAAEFRNPVMLYSIGKDSSVLLHLLLKAFAPGAAADPAAARRHQLEVPRDDRLPRPPRGRDRRRAARAHQSRRRRARASARSRHGATVHTDVMKTQALKQALDQPAASTPRSAARAATRRSRAPRSACSPSAARSTAGIRRRQRPELWSLYNTRIHNGESVRVFPLSNWTELDVWLYIYREGIPVRAAVLRQASARWSSATARLIMVDDERLPLRDGEAPQLQQVRFRTLGCYPLTGAIESDADTLEKIIARDAGGDAPPSARAA